MSHPAHAEGSGKYVLVLIAILATCQPLNSGVCEFENVKIDDVLSFLQETGLYEKKTN